MLGLVQTRPARGAGGVSDHSLLSNLAYPAAAHTGFCSLATVQTITAEKLIDSAVGLRFGHAAGPLLQGPASGALLTLTGDQRVAGRLGLSGATPNSLYGAYLLENNPGSGFIGHEVLFTGTALGTLTGFEVLTSVFTLANSFAFRGVSGNAVGGIPSGATSGIVRGLDFTAFGASGGGGAVWSEVTGVRTFVGLQAYAGSLTAMYGYRCEAPFILSGSPTITNTYGIYIFNQGPNANQQTAYGLYIADMTNAVTKYLIQAGPATPNLRLVANAPPNAGLATEGDSQLFLAWMENGGVNLRRVRWRQQSSLLATDRVLIAA